jgi:Fe-S cluster assembly iron-binding protein IscA
MMLNVTENAVLTLEAARRQQQIPERYGIRVFGEPTSTGELEVQIGFAEAPLENDAVRDLPGMRLFVAEEVAEPLADAELDVKPDVTSDGDAPSQLYLRAQQHPDEA